ncbi:MAG: hypothetical protein FWH01_11895 [Oscillospiraceae bacterium]|nr:hypothetical protein [Oscillospiraceae bacterium]
MKFVESDMDFSPLFENGDTISIEASKHRKSLGEGIKSVEFISLQHENKLFFVEGKSSSPKPDPDNKQKLDEFLDPIVEKFCHSFQIYLSTKFGIIKDKDGEFPLSLVDCELSELKIIFLLIIQGHERGWLMPVLDCLHKKLLVQRKIWKVEVVVWNDEIALQNAFIEPII